MNILDLIKKSLILFYIGLPLILISTICFLGFGLGNAGLLFLSAGHIVIVPLAVAILHFVTQNFDFSKVKYNDVGLLVPSSGISTGTEINIAPSYWISHVTFFCTYIFFNAYTIYYLPPSSDDSEDKTITSKVNNRKYRTALIMGFTLFTFLTFILIRYRVTNSENIVGMILGIGAMGGLGYGWYLASISSNIKTFDILGIVQQMSSLIDSNAKTLCVQQSK